MSKFIVMHNTRGTVCIVLHEVLSLWTEGVGLSSNVFQLFLHLLVNIIVSVIEIMFIFGDINFWLIHISAAKVNGLFLKSWIFAHIIAEVLRVSDLYLLNFGTSHVTEYSHLF